MVFTFVVRAINLYGEAALKSPSLLFRKDGSATALLADGNSRLSKRVYRFPRWNAGHGFAFLNF